MKEQYESHKFKADTWALIEQMNEIIDEYVEQGYRLTARQLYYQLVARDIVPNNEKSYQRVTSIVNDAKMAGVMDWDAIEDRTREFIRKQRWESGAHVLRAVAKQYHEDMWSTQKNRVFVVVEKEALAGVLEPVCSDLDIPLLAARGYPSGTVLREFSISDLLPCFNGKQTPIILHLGDHDPSGIDMSRDLSERFATFVSGETGRTLGKLFKRIALNMDQIEEQRPPENPAKSTDSRFQSYREQFGDSSWELDALKPDYLDQLVRDNAEPYIDRDAWEKREAEIQAVIQKLEDAAAQFEERE